MPSSSSGAEKHSTIQQEEFSYAFIGAIVTAAGYTIQTSTRSLDNVGIDIMVTVPGEIGKTRSPLFAAQVKSTSDSSCIKKTQIHYPLKVRNYEHLIYPKPYIPNLLIVVFVPKEISNWVSVSEERATIQKSAYWISLKGREPTKNTDTVTVQIPRKNLLTPQSLEGIMQRVVDKEL